MRELNQAILALAGGHVAQAVAPATFRDLMRVGHAAVLPVWEGASDRTLYGDPRINHAARAWHDRAHLAGGFDFTPAGERAACALQLRQLEAFAPSACGLKRP